MHFSLCQKLYLWLTAFLFLVAAVIAWNMIAWTWPLAINIPVAWAIAFAAGYCLSRVVRVKDALARQECTALQCLRRKRLPQETTGG